MQIEQSVAIVTGASGGIGAATARALAGRGARLILTGRNERMLQQLSSDLNDSRYLPGDVADPTFQDELFAFAKQVFGGVDILFNNAGVLVHGTIDTVDVERAASMLRLNVEAAIRLAYVALRDMKARGRGYVVNTSSVAGIRILAPATAAYQASKHALEAFSESVRGEPAGTGVGIACIQPGVVRTGLYDDWPDGPRHAVQNAPALTPDDIARGVLFILEQPEHVRIPKLYIMPEGEGPSIGR